MNKIIWLTGHSGSGKSTIAKKLQEDWNCIILDGDEMRESISEDNGFSIKDREEHNYRVAKLANVLVQQTNVVVSVIAPIKKVRDAINTICSPVWIYIKRTMPERENHFYEESHDYFTLDHDTLSIEESINCLKQYLNIEKKKYNLFIGRYQPLHKGHITLIQTVLDENKNVAIGLRDTPIDTNNPYTIEERRKMFESVFGNKVKVFAVPDIEAICHGRNVGWKIREIRLDKDTEKISASKIREVL